MIVADAPPIPTATDAGLIARLSAQRQKFKAAWSLQADKVAVLTKQVTDLTTERDALAAKGDTSAAAKRVDELTAELRGYKHRQSFDALAIKAGARPEALGDLWELSKIEAKTDEPDAAALQVVIDKQKVDRAWAFAPPAAPPDPNAPPPPKPAPGSGQGAGDHAASTFSEAQLADPKFVMANFDRITAAAQQRIASGQI